MSKAWTIQNDESSTVVFNNHGVAARRIGANELNTDFEAVECRRSKQYDSFAEKGWVPLSVLVKDGWWFECLGCDQRVSEYMIDNEGNEITPEVVDVAKDLAFCSPGCQQAHEEYKAQINQRHQKYMEKLRGLYPDLSLYEKEGSFYGNRYPSYTCTLFADFPGMKHAPATLRVDDVRKDSQKPGWYCAYGDKEAFDSWMQNRKAQPNDQ